MQLNYLVWQSIVNRYLIIENVFEHNFYIYLMNIGTSTSLCKIETKLILSSQTTVIYRSKVFVQLYYGITVQYKLLLLGIAV